METKIVQKLENKGQKIQGMMSSNIEKIGERKPYKSKLAIGTISLTINKPVNLPPLLEFNKLQILIY